MEWHFYTNLSYIETCRLYIVFQMLAEVLYACSLDIFWEAELWGEEKFKPRLDPGK